MSMESSRVIEAIREEGWARIPGVYSKVQVEQARARLEDWHERTRHETSERVPFLNIDQPMVYNLECKDFFFLELLFGPELMQQVVMHFLNDPWYKQIPADQPNYVLRTLVGRSSLGRLPMHIDSFVPYQGDHVFVIQYSILLEDQDESNGCTVVVPRSHRSGEYASQESFDSALPLRAEAGDVLIWDSRLWHGATENSSGRTRWAIIATFCRWWMKQHFNVAGSLPQEIYEKLSDPQKAVLGFCSIPYHDEREGIDLKRGYDSLLPDVRGYRRRG